MSPDSTATSPASQGAAPGSRPRNLGLALVLISAVQLMVVLDASIVNIALPHIQTDLGFSESNLTWVVTSYGIALGGLLLLGGRMGDVLGRRKIFMAGVLVFALASLFGGVAQNEWELLAARALQGLGAAAASPTALALITTTFPAGPPRNRAFAVYAAMSGAGAAIGLILGGALTEASWRWTMLINVPIGVLVAVLAPKFLNESAPRPGRFDVPGAVTATLGLIALVYGFNHKGQTDPDTGVINSWTELWTLGPILAGVGLLVAFFVIEARSRQPLLPLRIVSDRTRAVSFISMLLVGAAIFAMFLFLSLYIQNVLGYSPLKAGLAFLPFSFMIVVAAQLASTLASRTDPRWIAGTGGVLASVAMWGFSQLDYNSSYAGHLLPWILVMAAGMGLMFVPLTLTAVAGVDKQDSGVGSAVLNTVQQVGGAVGIALLGTVYANGIVDKTAELRAAAAQAGTPPTPEQLRTGQDIALAYGSTQAFGLATFLVMAAAAVVLVGLTIKHERLSTDGVPGVAA